MDINRGCYSVSGATIAGSITRLGLLSPTICDRNIDDINCCSGIFASSVTRMCDHVCNDGVAHASGAFGCSFTLTVGNTKIDTR